MQAEAKAGEINVGDGGQAPLRTGVLGDLIVSELHGRYFEQNRRGHLFCGGMGITSISNATFTTATTGVTATPVAGVWNPAGSPVDLIILQAMLGVIMTALQATGCGPFAWMASAGNTLAVPSTGAKPTNLKTLLQAGSFAVDMSGAALTGMTNVLRVIRGSTLNGGSNLALAFLATQVAMQPPAQSGMPEEIGGSIIVPPGGILALMATATGVAHSAVSGLVWEEQPTGK